MRKLAGTTWGANEKILKQVYHGNIRPSLEFGSGAYISAATTQINSLEKVQNQALRVITGAMRSTPIEKMQKITGIPPLKKRIESKALMMLTKAEALKDHPMHERTKQRGLGRLKRTSFMGQAKGLHEQFKENLPEEVEAIKLADDWREAPENFKIHTSVPDLGSKEVTSKEERRLLTLEMIEDRYHEEAWTHIFTDGSASDAVKNGGAGVYIQEVDGSTKVLSEPTGLYCTNYKAEVEALIIAAEEKSKDISTESQIVFFTDALSVLQDLEKGGLPKLRSALRKLDCLKVILQWIPSHCGISGNEEADRQAKLGAEKEQNNNIASYKETQTIIKALHRPIKLRDGYHGLKRSEQVCIFRLRTGHNRLNKHMHNRFKLVDSPKCSCGAAEQTAEHILQHCPNFQDLRREIWPTPTSFEDKLFGPTDTLKITANFIHRTNLSL